LNNNYEKMDLIGLLKYRISISRNMSCKVSS
jgi:hypothetical protein